MQKSCFWIFLLEKELIEAIEKAEEELHGKKKLKVN